MQISEASLYITVPYTLEFLHGLIVAVFADYKPAAKV